MTWIVDTLTGMVSQYYIMWNRASLFIFMNVVTNNEYKDMEETYKPNKSI